ncbi:MAG: helix-turn-helix transcriptional regulator [Gammaproteobacteria bacterium]|jgi:cytoskeleton protein RodZ|nr:helix-turn-helix transcriptional regulator [Gammaproteobacteria bacterium]
MTDTNLTETSELDSTIVESANSEQDQLPSPGQELKKLREELGYSYGKVSESIYITAHYVKALEDDDYEKLPGQPFIKGYYKAYAEFLRADTEQIINSYLSCVEKFNNQNTQDDQTEDSKNRNKTILWTAVVVVVIGALAGIFLL